MAIRAVSKASHKADKSGLLSSENINSIIDTKRALDLYQGKDIHEVAQLRMLVDNILNGYEVKPEALKQILDRAKKVLTK